MSVLDDPNFLNIQTKANQAGFLRAEKLDDFYTDQLLELFDSGYT